LFLLFTASCYFYDLWAGMRHYFILQKRMLDLMWHDSENEQLHSQG
jgi:hypothetical protein